MSVSEKIHNGQSYFIPAAASAPEVRIGGVMRVWT